MPAGERLRVLLADDHPLFAQGLQQVIDAQPDLRCVGIAIDGARVLELAQESRPDVIVLDLRMPRLNGIEVLRALAESEHTAPVIVLTTFDADEASRLARESGARGFLTKDATPKEVLATVRAVCAGETVHGRQELDGAVARYDHAGDDDALAALSSAERRVFALVAAGLGNREIAAALFVSEMTVKTHVTSILRKLGLRSRSQAIVFAFEHGIATGAGDR